MSTRSIIVVTDKNKTKRIYKHSDGYPTHNLEIIAKALEDTKTLDEIVTNLTTENKINVEEEFDFPLNNNPEKCLGDQGDLEWMYVIDVENKIVNVYGKSWDTDNLTAFKKGPTNPLEYVKELSEEYQKEEADTIKRYVQAIKKIGYLINTTSNSVVFIKRNLT